jgi:hypothetical protein
MSESAQSLPNCDVRVASVHPSISDIMLQRRERRNGPGADVKMPGSRSGRTTRRDAANSLNSAATSAFQKIEKSHWPLRAPKRLPRAKIAV